MSQPNLSPESNSPPPRWRIIAAFAAIYLVWGSAYLFIHYAVQSIPPFVMSGSRALAAGGLMFAWARLRGKPNPPLKVWQQTTLAGVLLIGLGSGSIAWSETIVPSGLTALLIATVPLWMVVLDWLWPGPARVPPRPRVIAGLVVGTAGAYLLVDPAQLLPAQGDPVPLMGAGVLLLAALSWATGSIYSRYAGFPSGVLTTSMEMLGGGAALISVAIATGQTAQVNLANITPVAWLAWAFLVFISSIVAFSSYMWLLRVVDPARVATYAFVNPAIAVALGWLVGEGLSGRTLLAGVCIVTAVALISLRSTKHTPSHI